MEQSNYFAANRSEGREVLETVVEQSEERVNDGTAWPLETNEYLEWLSNFDIPQFWSEQESKNVFVAPSEEDNLISISTTTGSDVSYTHWLSSLDNNSELDHQVADAYASTTSPAEFSAAELLNVAEVDEPDSRRHNNAFPFLSQPSSSGSDVERDSSNTDSGGSGPNSSVGFISDILDGVVFTPAGASELPRPSPDTRCRSTLSSFRPTEPPTEEEQPAAPVVSSSSQSEQIKAFRTKSPPPTDLETLFQRELAEKIKKRCQERQLDSSVSCSSSPISRSLQSALPPIPKAISSPVVVALTAADAVAAEFENPLYQTLDECFSGSAPPPTPPPLPTRSEDDSEEATYAVIDEREAPHYKTVVSGASVGKEEEEEEEEEDRVYAQVADDVNAEYDTAKLDFGSDSDAIYENLEEFQEKEQTYANIRPPPDCSHLSLSANVLTALVLDVNAATAAASSASRSSNGSSSGNSSSSPQNSSSSPEQLSPTDSLANVSVGSVRSIGTPDSGIFGLLKPAGSFSSSPSEEFISKVKPDQSFQQDLLDQTLKQFERLEQLSCGIFETSNKKMESIRSEQMKPVVLPGEEMAGDKMVAISEIPIERILDLAGSIEPSDVNSGSDEEEGRAPPRMPMSPPPSTHDPMSDGLFQASLVSVDSQGSSSLTSSSLKEGDSDMDSLTKDPRSIRSPEPGNNLGARIVEDQVKRMQQRDRVRNEKLGLEDVGESFDKLKNKRYDVIDEMTPKSTKRKDWLAPSPEPTSQLEPPPLDGNRRLSGGVNSESILVKKEETKAFWEGKMQSELDEPIAPTNGRSKMTKQISTLSPPPGFDNDFIHEEENEEAEMSDEPVLSIEDDFVDIGSITVIGDSESKPFVAIGNYEDKKRHIDVVDHAPLAVQTTAVQTEKPYFEPDRASSYSDDDEESDSPSSSTTNKATNFVRSQPNPTETLIEREIRLQHEREEAVLRERQKALEILEATRKQTTTTTAAAAKVPEVAPRKSLMVSESNKSKDGPSNNATQPAEIVAKKTKETKKVSEVLVSPAEIRISEEIRELKRREEELRQLREANARNSEDPSYATSAVTDDDYYSYSDAERDVSSSDANSSRVESPEAALIPGEYSKFPHQRTQSMDSMSSGHSSGDHVLGIISNNNAETTKQQRGRVASKPPVVVPFDDHPDQDQTSIYLASTETPIEREIRQAREREEALRREKGLHPGVKAAVSVPKQIEKEHRQTQRLVNGSSDKRDVQKSYAASVIQREIDEIAQRENELVRDGKILHTSAERADPKVFNLGDYSKKPVTSVPTKSVTPVHPKADIIVQRSDSVAEERDSPSELQAKKAPQMRVTYANRGYAHGSTASSGVAPTPATWRNPQVGQRGMMEKFLRGRLNSPATFSSPTSSTPSPTNHTVTPGSSAGDPVGVIKAAPAPVRYLPPAVKPIEIQTARREEEDDQTREKVVPPRRHYATTEEKIQQEFRDMQKREEELKLNRSKFLAKSQPNLLDIDEGISEPEPGLGGQLRSAHSISDLLEEEETKKEPSPASSNTVKGARRKSALIAQWENRIHQQDF